MSEAQSLEVPPRPEEIIDEDRIAYQAMSDLSDEKYADLAADIRERGVLDTILIDENDTILDGHHREAITQHYELSGSKAPSYLRLGDLEDDDEKLARAIKQNLLGRDTDQGVKADAVEQYITRAWPTDDETGSLVRPETNADVAEKLGVSEPVVGGVCKKLGSLVITHSRLKARQYYEENPDASYREVARQVDASNKTITEWLKEDFDEGDDSDADTEQQPLNMLARNQSEVEQTRELTHRARDEDEDDDVSEVAQEEAEKVASGRTSIKTASKNVEKKQAKEETERQRSEPDEVPARITEADAGEFINTFDDGEIDLLLTDPPYSSDIDDIREFAESWVPAALEKVASDGHAYICIGEYPEEIAAYYGIISEFEKFDEVQLLAWTYRNTLGRMPNRRYGRGWQAILYLCGEDADDLDVPETKEQFSAMDITAPDGRHGTKHHKWQKPAELFERFVRHSTDESDLVVDPFAGSGTTLLEAASLGRENRGCDADPEAIEAALERGCVSDA